MSNIGIGLHYLFITNSKEETMLMINLVLIASLIGLQIGDYLTTIKALSIRGLHESNSFLKKLFDKYGIKRVLIITKLLLIGWIIYLFLILKTEKDIVLTGILVILNGFYIVIVKRNYRKIQTKSKK